MRTKLSLLLCLLLLTGCTEQGSNNPDDVVDEKENNVQKYISNDTKDDETDSIVPADEDEANDKFPLKAFFMKDGTVAHYIIEGHIEFTTTTKETQFLGDNYVNEYTSNGGPIWVRTYRIEEDQILLLRAEVLERYGGYNPDKLELDSLEPIQVYMKFPIEKGMEFDSWVVIETDASLSTPFKDFENVIVNEHQSEDRTLYRDYLVEGFGTIKSEIIMPSDAIEPNISSTLERIE